MKTKNFITLLAVFGLISLFAACGNPSGDDGSEENTVKQPLDPAVTARDSAAFAERLEDFAVNAESGDVLEIDLARYEAALLRLTPAARRLNASFVKNIGAAGCFEYTGETSITVRLRNSGEDRKTLALKRTGGGGVSYAATDRGALLYVGRGVTLEVDGDITLEGISAARNGLDNTAPLVLVEGGTLTLSGGARIINNAFIDTSTVYGGGLAVAYNGQAVIKDAEISGCSAPMGGGAAVYSGGQLTLEKTALITNCAAKGNSVSGGGIAIRLNGPTTGGNYGETICIMKDDAKVTNCRIEGNGAGGGVGVQSATFRMYGNSEISGNEWAYKPSTTGAMANGGGVELGGGAIFIMRDKSAIKENRAIQQLNAAETFTNGNSRGGGVYISYSNNIFEMHDESSVSDNICAAYQAAVGAGIFIYPSGDYVNTIKIMDKSRIERNAAFILKNTKDRTILAEIDGFQYAQGSAVYVGNSQKIIMDGEAAIPRIANAANISEISEAARNALEASGISPENFVLLEKSDTTNSLELVLVRVVSLYPNKSAVLETGADYKPAAPLVIDIGTGDMTIATGRHLKTTSAATANSFSIFNTAGGLVCSIGSGANTGISDLSYQKKLTLANYTPLASAPTNTALGTWQAQFTVVPTTGDPKTYNITLEIPDTGNWTFTVTGDGTFTQSGTAITTFQASSMASNEIIYFPLLNIDYLANASAAERTILSGPTRNVPVTLGRLVTTLTQIGGTPLQDNNVVSYNGLPALPPSPFFPPVPLTAYTITSGQIVKR